MAGGPVCIDESGDQLQPRVKRRCQVGLPKGSKGRGLTARQRHRVSGNMYAFQQIGPARC